MGFNVAHAYFSAKPAQQVYDLQTNRVPNRFEPSG